MKWMFVIGAYVLLLGWGVKELTGEEEKLPASVYAQSGRKMHSMLNTILIPKSTKVTRYLTKSAPKTQTETKWISDLSQSSPMWLPPHKYHVF